MTVAAPIAGKTSAVAKALSGIMTYLEQWEQMRGKPGVSDFVFGNPQEMPLPDFVDSIRRHAEPQHKDWFAYKRSDADARAAVAKGLREWRGLPFEPDDISLTTGAFGALAVAFRAVLDPGDEVIFSLPPWFLYEAMLLSAGAVPIKVRVRQVDLDLDLDAIAAAIGPRTKAVIVNSPNNPTGRIYPPATLTALARLLSDASERLGRPIWLVSDEPYARLVFSDATFTSPSEYYPYTLLAYSYAKILLTPGQRIGWLAISPNVPDREHLREVLNVHQIASGWQFPNAVMQYAVPDLEDMHIDLVDLEAKRDRAVAALRDAGYELRAPEGTFYLWTRSPEPDDVAFSRRLATKDVLVLPGTVCEMPGFLRFSLTASNEMLDRALPILRDAVTQHS